MSLTQWECTARQIALRVDEQLAPEPRYLVPSHLIPPPDWAPDEVVLEQLDLFQLLDGKADEVLRRLADSREDDAREADEQLPY